MAPVTEIAIAKINESAGDLDGTGEGASIWQHTIDTILAQKGATRLFWGRVIEDPSMLRMFIEWESLDDHKRFEASEAYQTVMGKVMTIFSGITLMAHAEIKPLPQSARDVFTSPATELLSVFFPAEYTAAQQDKFEEDIHQFLKSIKGKAVGYRAAAAGWALEDNVPNLKKPGTKGRPFFLFVGWDAVESHLKFCETNTFKENFHYVRDAEDIQELLNMHFHGKEVVNNRVHSTAPS